MLLHFANSVQRPSAQVNMTYLPLYIQLTGLAIRTIFSKKLTWVSGNSECGTRQGVRCFKAATRIRPKPVLSHSNLTALLFLARQIEMCRRCPLDVIKRSQIDIPNTANHRAQTSALIKCISCLWLYRLYEWYLQGGVQCLTNAKVWKYIS